MRRIKLNRGYRAVVSDRDYSRCLTGTKWYAVLAKRRDGSVRTVYAARQVRVAGRKTTQLMHRFILGLTDPKTQADHRDGNGLINTRKNLRSGTNLQNSQNRTRKDPRSTSGVMGVYRDTKNQKWVAEIIVRGEYKFLGRFKSLRAARKARLAAEAGRGF